MSSVVQWGKPETIPPINEKDYDKMLQTITTHDFSATCKCESSGAISPYTRALHYCNLSCGRDFRKGMPSALSPRLRRGYLQWPGPNITSSRPRCPHRSLVRITGKHVVCATSYHSSDKHGGCRFYLWVLVLPNM